MLNSNPGLRDISHNITGGSLAAQGYWMPFEAAKAMATTFCWDIRYALTPIFGLDFPDLCIEEDDPCFGRMKIDPSIVQQCTDQANEYRLLSTDNSRSGSPMSITSSPKIPKKTGRLLRAKQSRPLKIPSGSTSASEQSPTYCTLPSSPKGSGWTALNTPRSVKQCCYSPTSLPLIDSIIDGQDSYSVISDDLDIPTTGKETIPKRKQTSNNKGQTMTDTPVHVSIEEGSPPGKRLREYYINDETDVANALLTMRYGHM